MQNTIVDLVSYAVWFFYVLTMGGLLIVKYRATGSIFAHDPNVRGLQVPGIIPVIFIVATLCVLVFPFMSPKMVLPCGLALAVIAIGIVPYGIVTWMQKREKSV
jgi:amino acid transporter